MGVPSAMTYLQFHLVFILPPLVVLTLLQRGTRGRAGYQPWWPLAAMFAAAFVYTTPWDNYLIANAVWTYPPDRVLATIGYVPVEEYAFFGLQTVLTGLWVRLLQVRFPVWPIPDGRKPMRYLVASILLLLALLGGVMIYAGGHWTYMGLIVAWAFPILALMWGMGGHLIWERRRLMAWAVIPTTLYLWTADRIAIGLDIWHITDATRTGVELFGLPIEEALFFLVTNLLVAQGLVMLERPTDGVVAA